MGCMVGMVNLLAKEAALPEPGPGLPDHQQTTETAPKAEMPVEPSDEVELSPAEALAMLQKHLTNHADTMPNGPCVIAVNVSVEVKELMNILGVDKFVRIGGTVELGSLETAVLPGKEMASDKRRALVLKAHENLVEIDKRNEAQFGAFLKSLSAELSRSKESLTEPKNPSN